MRFNEIRRVVLFGGSPLLVELSKWLARREFDVRVYTAPRQAAEALEAGGKTLAEHLDALGQRYVVTEDINAEPGLRAEVDEHTLGLGLGEAWSFDEDLIAYFSGRLIDFMGIPLPRYRGGAHYTWMILRGDREMACHLQVVNADTLQGVRDTGAIIKSRRYSLPETVRIPADYFREAVKEEIDFLREFFDEVKKGKEFAETLADESASLYLPRLNTRRQGFIDWSWSGEEIERFIRAFDDPYPGASTLLDGAAVELKGARLDRREAPFHPFQAGLITRLQADGGVMVATRDGHLSIARVLEDGRALKALLEPGQRFHTPGFLLDQARSFRAEYGAKAGDVSEPSPGTRRIQPGETFLGERVLLRLVTFEDVGERYVAWLRDPNVNRFLETRFLDQTLASVREFVGRMLTSTDSYLFAIVENQTSTHIGNLKIGPIERHHAHADVSYFIGERDAWGQGYATDAIRVATRLAFERLGLHRLQAGSYENNAASIRALEKAGYVYEGRLKRQLRFEDDWQDHVFYGIVRDGDSA